MNVLLLNADDFLNQSCAFTRNDKIVFHVQNILKAEVGDVLKVGVLGSGIGEAVIESFDGGLFLKKITLNKPPPPKIPMTVVLALPRPKVLRRLIMDMTAIGVSHIVLVNSYRTDKSYWQSPLLARLDEFVIEGLSQAVDTIAPKITLARRFKPFVEDELPCLGKTMAVFHPYGGQKINDYLSTTQPDVVMIGAEGGWINYEIELLKKQGIQVVGLGERILRTEAAVNVVLSHFL